MKVLLIIALALVASSNSGQAQEPTYYTKRGYVACASKENTAKALRMRDNYNITAADAFVADPVNNCKRLAGGETAYLISKADRLVEIRLEGKDEILWAAQGAISK
jgi:hypothetical protein